MLKSSPIRWIAFVALVVGPAALQAQMHKVEKPEKVTRAIGVYEWTGDFAKPTAARLVPVSLFVDSHFEDAGVYLASPVPFVLQTGDEYSIERAGESLGLLDIDYARDLVTKHGADDDGTGSWYGYGKFLPPAPPKKSNLKASAVKPVIAGGDAPEDDQPHFVVRQGAEDTTGPVKPAGNKSSGDKTPTTPNPAPTDDPDRPTLRHRDPQTQNTASGGRSKREKDSGSVIPVRGSLNDDPDRPTLRRGVSAEQLIPKQLEGVPASLHQVVAVSDAASRDPHNFKREWESRQEHNDTLATVQALAKPLVAAYLTNNKLQGVAVAPAPSAGPSFASTPKTTAAAATPPAKSTTAKTAAARRTAAKKAAAAPPVPTFSLTNEVLEGYQLSYGGLPTFIYTAEVPVAAGGPVYVTMVVQRLPAGELQVALTSVTDAQHLNRVPWMRPVDVVDADASHRASLLMELRAQSSRQFALYRLVTAQAEQTFVTGIIQ